MEDDPEIEFDHYLSERLSMTVDRMRREMPAAEYMAWSVYYRRKAQRLELERLRAGG